MNVCRVVPLSLRNAQLSFPIIKTFYFNFTVTISSLDLCKVNVGYMAQMHIKDTNWHMLIFRKLV